MPTIDDYVASLRKRTAREYRATATYLEWWLHEKENCPSFASYIDGFDLAAETKQKHLRQAKTLCLKCNLDYPIGSLPTPPKSSPPKFADRDFPQVDGGLCRLRLAKVHHRWRTLSLLAHSSRGSTETALVKKFKVPLPNRRTLAP